MSTRDDKPMTDADLADIEARANAATKGPWRSTWGDAGEPPAKHPDFGEEMVIEAPNEEGFSRNVVGVLWYDGPHTCCREKDAEFIARAREDVPNLLVEVRSLRAEVARWRSVTGADSPDVLDAALVATRSRARGKTTRGHLVCAVNDAGADRVEAQHARDTAAALHKQSPTAANIEALAVAEQRLTAAKEGEQTARADLAAFEKAHGLTIACREQESA